MRSRGCCPFVLLLLATGCEGSVADPAKSRTFYAHAETRLGGCAESVTTGDLNGDGNPDAVVALDAANQIAVLLGNGAGGLEAPTTLPMTGQPREVTLTDVNADQTLDLLVVQLQTRSLQVLLNQGDGTFLEGPSLDLDLCPGTARGLAGPEGLALGDLNGDGHADLVVTQAQDSLCQTLGLFLGAGEGRFPTRRTVDLPGVPSAAVVVHLNTDGHADLAVTLRDRAELLVMAGNGTGSLGDPITHRTGRTPGSIAAGDFDQDGDLDLVTANREDSTLSVFTNQGEGGFGLGETLQAGTITDQVVASDLNHDGWVDLAAANGGLDELTLHEGTGTGFRPALFYPAGHCINDLALADLDNDGKQDILAANCGGESVSVFHHDRRVTAAPATARRRGRIPSEAIRHPGAHPPVR